MGLDVYCYKVKNKEDWNKSVKVTKEFDAYSSILWDKYEKESKEAYKKWFDWYNGIIERYENNEISFDECNEELNKDKFNYKITDFATSDEKLKYNILLAQRDAAVVEREEIKNLYMRKKYWFIQYCYHKFEQYLTIDEKYKAKVLADEHYYDMLLNKDDVKDIVHKLILVVDSCSALMSNEDVKKIISKMDFTKIDFDTIVETNELQECSKLVVNLEGQDKHLVGLVNVDYVDSIFPVYKEYVHSYRPSWNYCAKTFEYYLKEWQKVLDDMTDDEYIWINESW